MFTVKRFMFASIMALLLCAMLSPTFASEGQIAPVSREFLMWQERNRAEKSSSKLQGNASDNVGLNIDEYATGAIPDIVDRSELWRDPPHPQKKNADVFSEQIPVSYDMRLLNVLPPIRNQNPWGACWAFATLSSLESNFLKKGLGSDIDLSEMHVAFFVYGDDRPGKSFALTNKNKDILNQGGNSNKTTALLTRTGTVSESILPYPTGKYTYDAPDKYPEEYERANIRIKETYQLGVLSGDAMRETVKNLIMNEGAVYIHYYSKSGAYKSPEGEGVYFNNEKTASGDHMPINHAVALVGWDDNFPRESFDKTMSPDEPGAWLVRNNWGNFSGSDNGYFWMSYEQYIDGVAMIIADKTEASLKHYGYDDLGQVGSWSYKWSANIFKAEYDEILRYAGFYTVANNASYDIYVYDLGTASTDEPVAGTLLAHKQGYSPYAGYHTEEISGGVKLEKGHYFSVVMNNDKGTALEMIYESYYPAVVNPHESYLSSNGSSWFDVGSRDQYNACIKAFTIPDPENTFTFDSATFPDTNFRDYLTTKYGAYISLEDLAEITALDLSNLDITDLTGITYFTGLQYLDISGNASLDIINITGLASLDLKNITTDPGVNILEGDDAGKIFFGKHSLILSGKIGLDFYVSLSDDVKSSDVQVFFSVNDKTVESPKVSEGESTSDGYLLSCGVQSIQMAEEITASASYNESSVTQKYRVSDYLTALLKNLGDTQSADLLNLANSIKDYGHYVQKPLADYNGWEYGVKYATMDYATASDDMTIMDEESTALNKFALSRDKTASYTLELELELDSDTALNLYFSPKDGATIDSVACASEDAKVFEESDGTYTVNIKGISAHRLGDMYTVNVRIGGVTYPVKISALSYACIIMNTTSASDYNLDDMKKAVLALYRYYTATIAYRDSLSN